MSLQRANELFLAIKSEINQKLNHSGIYIDDGLFYSITDVNIVQCLVKQNQVNIVRA